jgi:2-amino-4-hydroxy-6-hydroxymethyldihydropteridine diphosphokinase
MENFVILSLGSNLGERKANLSSCIRALQPILKVQKVSNIYESDALLLPDSPPEWNLNFFNLCVSGITTLEPLELLSAVKKIEESIAGKKRDTVWGPRNIDIDIIAYNNHHLHFDNLTIPHQRTLERTFVLWPLAEIEPEWKYPVQGENFGKNAIELAQNFGVKFPEEVASKPTPLNTKLYGAL